MIEIDENLSRAELTPTQEAEHLTRRKSIWNSIQADRRSKAEAERFVDSDGGEQVGQVVPPVAKHGRAQEKEFATETATATGKSKRDINRSIHRATAVCQEARDLIRGTALDTGSYVAGVEMRKTAGNTLRETQILVTTKPRNVRNEEPLTQD